MGVFTKGTHFFSFIIAKSVFLEQIFFQHGNAQSSYFTR